MAAGRGQGSGVFRECPVSVLIEAVEVEGFGGLGVVASAFGDVLGPDNLRRAALTAPRAAPSRDVVVHREVAEQAAAARDERDRALSGRLSGDGTRPCPGGRSGGRNLAGKAAPRETVALITTLGRFS